MDDKEKIPVFVRIEKGRTVCICHADCKGCKRHCPTDMVERDRFEDWQRTLRRDRYGK